mmetsp:Transcript_10799/g.29810  ORF Transcript_10799/g.29810 Transcript_10799/m.29810 type:complete len:91 (-) Transcript_10799:683-955(-)
MYVWNGAACCKEGGYGYAATSSSPVHVIARSSILYRPIVFRLIACRFIDHAVQKFVDGCKPNEGMVGTQNWRKLPSSTWRYIRTRSLPLL